jgi:hypothetical protein
MQKHKPLNELYAQLGAIVGDILDHPDTPAAIRNHLTEFICNLDNETSFHKSKDGQRARALMPVCLRILTEDEEKKPAPIDRAAA